MNSSTLARCLSQATCFPCWRKPPSQACRTCESRPHQPWHFSVLWLQALHVISSLVASMHPVLIPSRADSLVGTRLNSSTIFKKQNYGKIIWVIMDYHSTLDTRLQRLTSHLIFQARVSILISLRCKLRLWWGLHWPGPGWAFENWDTAAYSITIVLFCLFWSRSVMHRLNLHPTCCWVKMQLKLPTFMCWSQTTWADTHRISSTHTIYIIWWYMMCIYIYMYK